MSLFDWFMPGQKDPDITSVSAPTTTKIQRETTNRMLQKLWRSRNEWLETSPEGIVDRWQQYIADPMMAAWQQTAGPYAARKYNLPGSFYSADVSRGMMREAESFLKTNLFPPLYGSIENQQARLQGLMSSLATGQMMNTDTIVQEQPDYFGQAMQMAPFLLMAL